MTSMLSHSICTDFLLLVMPATLHEPPSQNSNHFLFYKTLTPRLPPSSTILFPLKMASNNNAFILLFLNLLFYALISSHSIPCPPSISKPKPKHHHHHHWPSDALKLGVCANVLGGLININLGQPPKKPCCSLIEGLADLEAAVCLCTVIKAEVLGINLNVPVSLSLLLNYFGKKLPAGFQCA